MIVRPGKPLSPPQESSALKGLWRNRNQFPSFHKQDKGKPRGSKGAWSHTAREGRPGPDAPHRMIACTGLGPSTAAGPVLLLHSRGVASDSQTFAPWKAVFLHPYLMRSVKSAGWGRHPHLVDGDTETEREEGSTCCRSLAGPTSSHFNLENPS